MSSMASKITGVSIVYSTVCPGADKKTSKLRVTCLYEGNSPVTGKFTAHRASNVKDSSKAGTPKIVKLIKRRDRVYKKRRRAKRNFNHSATGYQNADKKLKQLKKEIQTKLRQAYWSYIESIITPVENDSGTASGMMRFWQFVKSKRKERVGVATLKVDGKSVSNPRDKANELNKQFESVFTREGPLNNDLLPDQSPHPTMSDIDITEPGVRKMLEKLNVHKAQGPDEIGPQILKNLASTIAPILTVIYRRSYETGRIPEDWRMANVVPAYKKGKNSLPSNYRPISLTCIACKMMEHIVTSSIMKHANNHGILYSLQHGFRDRRSCETQLIEFQADILPNIKNGMQTDVLIMDFSKAIDKVGHMHLMEKLKYYGVVELALVRPPFEPTSQWRHQFVVRGTFKKEVACFWACCCPVSLVSGVSP